MSNLTECEVCKGTGYEICKSPDHGIVQFGCPFCGHDPMHRIINSPCPKCKGYGKIKTKGVNNERQKN